MSQPVADPPRTALPVVPTAGQPAIDYELLLDCVHCGLCTNSCPTYVETGHEADSPRGRIHLMRAVIDGRLQIDADVERHLDLCLNCRACETACPSGVQYGKLIEPFRLHMEGQKPNRPGLPWLQRQVLFKVFPKRGLTRAALLPVRLMQRLGVDRLAEKTGAMRLLPRWMREMHGMLPGLRPHYGSLPEVLPAEGPVRARVGLFLGCVADGVFPETNLATARVLQKNGCEVHIPRSQQCCGALHYHSAMGREAEQLAAVNCRAFGLSHDGKSGSSAPELDAIITNAAGCGAMLKDYTHLLHHTPQADAGAKFQAKVRDIHEFLMELGPVKPTHPLPIKATYHDACHLCHAQRIREQPRKLLALIPGLEVVPLPESELCCGAAGSYNLTQPEMAEKLGRRKVANIRGTGARAVFTGNVGCQLQILRHLRSAAPDLWVAHPIDALWASYSGDMPAALTRLDPHPG
jgi:glycolate oxidase iron-sulfur subunit